MVDAKLAISAFHVILKVVAIATVRPSLSHVLAKEMCFHGAQEYKIY